MTEATPIARLSDALDIHALFPTPLVITALAEPDAVNDMLAALILARAADHASVAKSNRGGWQSSDDFPVWGGPAGDALIAAARGLVDKVTVRFTDGKLLPADIAWRVNGWANVNRAGDANELHTHAGSYWSCVYYVDAGDDGTGSSGGAFEVADPRGVAPTLYAPSLKIGIRNCLTAGLSEHFMPRTGQLFLFPAWLSHGVRPYAGTRPRISVAFNFCL